MRKYVNPVRQNWATLCQRPVMELEFLEGTVKNIINRVKITGDDAIRELSLQFDYVNLGSLAVTASELNNAGAKVSGQLKQAIGIAIKNIETFHMAQVRENITVETMPGVKCWRKALPIDKIGIYVPGGSAPLFSTLLMLAVPAKLAGCEEIIVCTPPRLDGSIDSAILFAAKEIGISKVFKVGGAQAIAAMAYGTHSIPSVYKIFGPGNQFVTKAKQLISLDGVAIDLPAGPSEVLVVADDNANPGFVAADLLSQAEHGEDSQVVLLASSSVVIDKVQSELDVQISVLPRKEMAAKSLRNSLAIEFTKPEDTIDFVNAYAPEHLILNTNNCASMAERITNAGSVFLGTYSPESVGDYASGTNHTLPTNGFAKSYSGVSLESFQKLITFQQLTRNGLKLIGPVVEVMAAAENLIAHQRAVSIRLAEK